MSENGNQDLTATQRAMLAADAVEQGLALDEAIAYFNASKSSVSRALAIKRRDTKRYVASMVRRGKLSMDEASRRVGLAAPPNSLRRGQSFARGDKWVLATEGLKRYLRHWRDREYPHINPREAERRLAITRELIDGLQRIEAEFERRSVRGNFKLTHHTKGTGT